MTDMEKLIASSEAVQDKVIFKKIEKVITKGGICLIPDGYRRVMCGTVLAVGPGKQSQKTGKVLPTTIKPGDVIVYDSTTAFKIDTHHTDDFGVRWIPENSVLAVTDDPNSIEDAADVP